MTRCISALRNEVHKRRLVPSFKQMSYIPDYAWISGAFPRGLLVALATTILTAATASLTACLLLTSIPVALR